MSKIKVARGDFQTPLELAKKCSKHLKDFIIHPDIVIEPTCGLGAFIEGAFSVFGPDPSYVGYDINADYIAFAKNELESKIPNLELRTEDFFQGDAFRSFKGQSKKILLIGNPPWVTNSTLGAIDIANNPEKRARFTNGFDNISGKSNFDISEWMLENLLENFWENDGYFAFLIKSSVARRLFIKLCLVRHVECDFFQIDAKESFGVSVDAGFFVLKLNQRNVQQNELRFYAQLMDSEAIRKVRYTNGQLSDSNEKECQFERKAPPVVWRSGVKHDCSKVMELQIETNGELSNGYGEKVSIESDLLYPMLKSSDVSNGRLTPRKLLLVPQQKVGQSTSYIREIYPKTWEYLEKYSEQLNARKSSIYKKTPPFSIFGVGDYSFKKWKIAISGLYKKLEFQLVGPINSKSVMFDDTCYFIAFGSEGEAKEAYDVVTSDEYKRELAALIFWDSKRPVTSAVLNSLDYSTNTSLTNNTGCEQTTFGFTYDK